MISKIKNWFKSRTERVKLENWYFVSWDEDKIHRKVSPPGRKAWSDDFEWSKVIRICFEATDFMYPDNIYFFTSEQEESYMIPTEASGAMDLWNAVIDKGMFNPKLAIDAATSEGGIFCWPEDHS